MSTCSKCEGKLWNRYSEWTAAEAATLPLVPSRVHHIWLCKLVCSALASTQQRPVVSKHREEVALLPPEPRVHLSELAWEQVTYENRPHDNTFDSLFLGKGDILNSKQYETQL